MMWCESGQAGLPEPCGATQATNEEQWHPHAFAMGFDHIALCAGAGKPTVLDLPNGLAALGILVTIGAGLYIILRERRLARS